MKRHRKTSFRRSGVSERRNAITFRTGNQGFTIVGKVYWYEGMNI